MDHAWIEKYFDRIFSMTNRCRLQKLVDRVHIGMPYTIRTIRKYHSNLDSFPTHLSKFSDDRRICEISMFYHDGCRRFSELSKDFSSHSQSILDRHEYLDSSLYLARYTSSIFSPTHARDRVSKFSSQSYHIVMPSCRIRCRNRTL